MKQKDLDSTLFNKGEMIAKVMSSRKLSFKGVQQNQVYSVPIIN